MDQVEVKIKGMPITQRYGTLTDGTLLRTDAAFAKHLVEDCKCAEYVVAAEPAAPAVEATAEVTNPEAQPAAAEVETQPADAPTKGKKSAK